MALPALLYALGQAQAGTPLWWHMNSLLLGGTFAAMALYTGDIWMAVGAHWLWNVVWGPVLGFAAGGLRAPGLWQAQYTAANIWNGGALGPEGGAAVTLLAMAWLAAWLTWGAVRGEKTGGCKWRVRAAAQAGHDSYNANGGAQSPNSLRPAAAGAAGCCKRPFSARSAACRPAAESQGREVRAGEKGRPLQHWRYGFCCKIKRRPAHKAIIIALTAAFYLRLHASAPLRLRLEVEAFLRDAITGADGGLGRFRKGLFPAGVQDALSFLSLAAFALRPVNGRSLFEWQPSFYRRLAAFRFV